MDPYNVWDLYINDVTNDKSVENMLPLETITGGNTGRRIMLENFTPGFESTGIWNNIYTIGPVFDFDYLDLWKENQEDIIETYVDETRDHERYEVSESVAAGYIMTKLN